MNAKHLISIFCSLSLMLALSGCDWCGCCSKTKAPETTKSEDIKSPEMSKDHTQTAPSIPKSEESMPKPISKPVEPKMSMPVMPHPEEPIRPMPVPQVPKIIEPKIAPMPEAPKIAAQPKAV